MTEIENRPQWRPYLEYLQRLGDRREARGEAPAPDVAPEEYWRKWRENNQIESPEKKAA